jgi:DNA end-binding protein Ku
VAAIWKGAITFGLVNIPVELRTAVRTDSLSFRMLHEEDLAPIKYERISSASGEPVPWNEIVKGYEYEKGKYVVMTDDDFKAAALESSRTFDILDFVKQEEIDPRYFDKPYFLLPSKGGEKGYALLREAIRNSGSTGIGKIIIRQKQHLAAIKTVGDALVLEIMRFSNELVGLDEYSFPSSEGLRPQEIKMAEQLIASLEDTFDPEKYTDDHRENVEKVIKAKMKGKKIKVAEPEPEEEDGVIDLMARLRESLEQGKRGGKAKGGTTKKTGRATSRTSARKSRAGAASKEKAPARRKTAKSA